MKYNEAIGMIFNGGEAVLPSREYSKDYRLHFNEDGVLCVPRVEHTKSAPVLHKADLKRDDWIVEKDGVVYDDFYSIDSCLKRCNDNLNEILSDLIKKRLSSEAGVHKQDKPAELEELKEIPPATKFTPFRESVIDEDWLEAKMLCFVRRYNNECGAFDKVTCGESGCQFCFPQAEPEGTLIPADKVILYTCIHGTYPCEECYEKYKKENKHSRQPREKVTVEDILWLLDRYVDALSIYHNALSAGDEPIVEKHTLMSLNKHYLMREIKYLVSLQEN